MIDMSTYTVYVLPKGRDVSRVFFVELEPKEAKKLEGLLAKNDAVQSFDIEKLDVLRFSEIAAAVKEEFQ